jgi:hypothetical protein
MMITSIFHYENQSKLKMTNSIEISKIQTPLKRFQNIWPSEIKQQELTLIVSSLNLNPWTTTRGITKEVYAKWTKKLKQIGGQVLEITTWNHHNDLMEGL